jgi:predicted secreted Zn-dependent protease
MRTKEEIDNQLNLAADQEEKGGSQYPGMTYEQGVQAALLWVTEKYDETPLGPETE